MLGGHNPCSDAPATCWTGHVPSWGCQLGLRQALLGMLMASPRVARCQLCPRRGQVWLSCHSPTTGCVPWSLAHLPGLTQLHRKRGQDAHPHQPAPVRASRSFFPRAQLPEGNLGMSLVPKLLRKFSNFPIPGRTLGGPPSFLGTQTPAGRDVRGRWIARQAAGPRQLAAKRPSAGLWTLAPREAP